MGPVISVFRLGVGLLFVGLFMVLWVFCLLLLLPWRMKRIRLCNHFGSFGGRIAMWLTGCPLTLRGRGYSDGSNPALFVSNHTSVIDALLAVWLSPVGTVGVAKREIAWYPVVGLAYLLSGHLRIDRRDHDRAIQSMNELGEFVRKHGLSVFMWPEGTRSRDGRLLALKKGVVHMAIQTRLPIVPMMVSGAQRAWAKNRWRFDPVPITVEFLPPLDTSNWSLETMKAHLEELRALMATALPENQRPISVQT